MDLYTLNGRPIDTNLGKALADLIERAERAEARLEQARKTPVCDKCWIGEGDSLGLMASLMDESAP